MKLIFNFAFVSRVDSTYYVFMNLPRAICLSLAVHAACLGGSYVYGTQETERNLREEKTSEFERQLMARFLSHPRSSQSGSGDGKASTEYTSRPGGGTPNDASSSTPSSSDSSEEAEPVESSSDSPPSTQTATSSSNEPSSSDPDVPESRPTRQHEATDEAAAEPSKSTATASTSDEASDPASDETTREDDTEEANSPKTTADSTLDDILGTSNTGDGLASKANGSGTSTGDGTGPGAGAGAGRAGGEGVGPGESRGTGFDRGEAIRGYSKEIYRLIRRHKEYPVVARRAKLEGTVVVAIVIDEKGRVLEVELDRSSGHSVLDESALSTVRAIEALPAPPSRLGWTRKRLRIPIRYQLENG